MRSILIAALAEIHRAGKGLDIYYHRFDYDDHGLALASTFSPEHERLAIEVDLCPARLPDVTLREEDARSQRRKALRHARDGRRTRGGRF
jgi:hypothetical protein